MSSSMAIHSLSFGSSNFANLSNEIDSCFVVEVRALRQCRSISRSKGFVNGEALSLSSSTYNPSITARRERSSFMVTCMFQPNHESDSAEPAVTILHKELQTSLTKDSKVIGTSSFTPDTDNGGVGGNSFGGSDDGNGKFTGGGGGGGDHDDDDKEAKEFGPIMKFEQVMKEVEARGATLPSDMLEAAKTVGIRQVILLRYLDLQGKGLLGAAIRSCRMLRNRMLADPAFLFKVLTEVVIDSCCATFAEVQKRGKDFWAEFELYAADLLVGVVVDVALVGLLAPYVRFGQPSISNGFFGRMQRASLALPSSVFEAERPGCKFSVLQRFATYFYKGVLYGSVGFGCGLIGQGIANMIMTAKRNIKTSEEDVPVPPLIRSAALWGVFLAVSSNTRYQVINGLERIVEASPLAKQIPPIALAFTVGVRFANNVYGGMQFVDWARSTGCQ